MPRYVLADKCFRCTRSHHLHVWVFPVSFSYLFGPTHCFHITMPRRKKAAARRAPGRKSWIYGTKLKFFESRKDEWLSAAQKSKAGAFYTKVARLYRLKYGDLAEDDDLEEDTDDPEDDTLDLEEEDEWLTPAEREDAQKKFKVLRDVSTV